MARDCLRRQTLDSVFRVWQRIVVVGGLCYSTEVIGQNDATPNHAENDVSVWRAPLFAAKLREARSLLELRCHRSVVDKAAKADLNVWLADLALRANTAADTNDWAAVFGFARLLKSPHDKPHTSIFHEDGSTITESELIAERWHRHWVKFFRADTCSYRSLAAEQAKDAVGPHRMEDAVVDDVFAIIKGPMRRRRRALTTSTLPPGRRAGGRLLTP